MTVHFGRYVNALSEFMQNKDGLRTAFMNTFMERHGITDGKLTPELKEAWVKESTEYITNRAKELASNE